MFEVHSLIFNFIDINTNTTVAEEIFQMSSKLRSVHHNISQDRICIPVSATNKSDCHDITEMLG
jgi:hypothetical protein